MAVKARTDRGVNHARGTLRHLAGLATPNAVAGLQAVLEPDLPLRVSRLRQVAVGHLAERARPRQARMRALMVAPEGGCCGAMRFSHNWHPSRLL